MANRNYAHYFCDKCGYNRDYLESEDPDLGPCPSCDSRNTFFKKYIEKKVKRGKVKRR